jgi:hypothetical protein
VRCDQPEAREGQTGRSGVAERFVVPLKPGIQRSPFFCRAEHRLLAVQQLVSMR